MLVIVIIPPEELLTPGSSVQERGEAIRVVRLVFEGLEVGLGKGVVVADARAAEAPLDTEAAEQLREAFRAHGGAAIGVDRERAGLDAMTRRPRTTSKPRLDNARRPPAQPGPMRAAYVKWKQDLLVSDGAQGFLRVRRPNSVGSINTSNSEGIAYGMTLAVAMDEQEVFGSLGPCITSSPGLCGASSSREPG
jgi:Glycosyl hydrolases family 8